MNRKTEGLIEKGREKDNVTAFKVHSQKKEFREATFDGNVTFVRMHEVRILFHENPFPW